jgi:succinoglycan biosynthesis protein ExoA
MTAATVDVIVPARDAAALLEDCLGAIARQTRPPDRVFVVVGRSGDATDVVARRLAAAWPSVQVLVNPAGDRGSALNEGLERSTADWVAMVDAQSRLEPYYLEAAVGAAERTDAAVVGGAMRPWAPGVVGGAIAAALRSRFGVGDSRFHDAAAEGRVESVYLGVYRRTMLDLVGRYDTRLLRTEDDDMNARVRAAGGLIWLDPAVRSTYLCRDNLAGLVRQYHGYGFWKARFLRQRPSELRFRHVVPSAFLVAVVAAVGVSLAVWPPALPLLAAIYLVAALAATIGQPYLAPLSRLTFPLATATMHLAYGAGFLRGLLTR